MANSDLSIEEIAQRAGVSVSDAQKELSKYYHQTIKSLPLESAGNAVILLIIKKQRGELRFTDKK